MRAFHRSCRQLSYSGCANLRVGTNDVVGQAAALCEVGARTKTKASSQPEPGTPRQEVNRGLLRRAVDDEYFGSVVQARVPFSPLLLSLRSVGETRSKASPRSRVAALEPQ